MKRFLLALALVAAPGFATTFTFTTPPFATNITHTGARILAATSVPVTAWISWDTVSHSCSLPAPPAAPCSEYGHYDQNYGSYTTLGMYPVVNWFVGGAPANTTIHYQVCGTPDALTYTCSGDLTFMTSALPNPHPAVATLPTTTPNPVVPTVTGVTRTVGVTSGCNDLASCWSISQCGDSYGFTDAIQLPSATPQLGSYDFSASPKTCSATNQLLIETDQAAVLSPAKVRIDPSYTAVLASLEPAYFMHGYWGAFYSTTLVNNNCHPGYYAWVTNDLTTPGWFMQQCVQNTTNYSITNITACSNGYPNCSTVTTSPSNTFSVGDIIYSSGVVGLSVANGTCRVMTSGNPYTETCAAEYIDYVNTAYISGGTVANHVWQAVPYHAISLGASPGYAPPSGNGCPYGSGQFANEGDWGYDSRATENTDGAGYPVFGVSSTGSTVRCVQNELGTANVWRRWAVALGDPGIEITYPSLNLSGSSYIYVLGLRLAGQKVPPEPLFARDGGAPEAVSAFQAGKLSQVYLLTNAASNNITIDRCIVDGIGYPRGDVAGALTLHGDNIAVINSYIREIGHWFGAADRGPRYDTCCTGASILRSSGTGFLESNNYIEGYGITTILDGATAGGMIPDQDATIYRNTFFRNPSHFFGNAMDTVNIYWPLRQLWEIKAMIRAWINGNILRNNFRNTSAATALQFEPGMGDSNWWGQAVTTTGGNTILWPSLSGTAGLSVGNWVACTISSGNYQLYQAVTVTAVSSGCTNAPTCPQVTVASIPNSTVGYGIQNLCAPADYPTGMSDITVTNNSFFNLPNAIGLYGHCDFQTCGWQPAWVAPMQRVTMKNNLYAGVLDDNPIPYLGSVPGTTGDPNIWESNGGGDVFYNPHPLAFDIISNHETAWSIAGGSLSTLIASGGAGYLKSVEGLYVTDNIGSMRDPSTCPVVPNCATALPVNSQAAGSGTAMFSAAIVNGKLGSSLYQMAGGDPSPGGTYPASIQWVNGIASLKFDNALDPSMSNFYAPQTMDFHLHYDSPGKSGSASRVTDDGLDAGADIDALEIAQGTVKNVHDHDATTTSTIIGLIAPDSFACSVDYGSDPAFGFTGSTPNYTRVGGSGGQRVQNVTITGLTTKTTYQYRVNCAAMQPTGVFLTH